MAPMATADTNRSSYPTGTAHGRGQTGADERWNAKAKYIETPKKPEQIEGDAARERYTDEATKKTGNRPTSAEETKQTGSNPGTTWQPEAWVPGARKG